MKKNYGVLFLLAFCIIWGTASLCSAQEAAKKSCFDVDGQVWMHSKDSVKRGFLLGAESALVLEYHIRTKHSEAPSKFVTNWVEGLKDMTWQQISDKIDAYYRAHPDKMDKNVFDVIWHEIIAPKAQG